MTAFDAVFRQAGLQRGETLLIHASGVGTAVQLARRAGARTIGTSRTASKLKEAVNMGLDVGLDGGEAWERHVSDVILTSWGHRI